MRSSPILTKATSKGATICATISSNDYEGINLDIISKVIRERLPIIKTTAQKLLDFYTK